MSVVKSKRTQSKIEFEMTFFKVADGVDFLVENQFFADYEQMQAEGIPTDDGRWADDRERYMAGLSIMARHGYSRP